MFEPNNSEPKVGEKWSRGGSVRTFLRPRRFEPPPFKPKRSNLDNCEPGVRKTAARGLNRAFLNRRRSKPPPVLHPNPNVRTEQLRTESAKMVAWGVSANVFCTPGGSNRPRSNPNVRIWTIANRGCEKRPRGGLNRAFLNRRRPKPPPVLYPSSNVRIEQLRTESAKNGRVGGQCERFLHPRRFEPPPFKPKRSNLGNCEPGVRKTAARGVKSCVS